MLFLIMHLSMYIFFNRVGEFSNSNTVVKDREKAVENIIL